MTLLTEYEGLPAGLLELPAARLHERLSGPTLLHLPGRQVPPLFVSVLLHGNEDTGWEAMRALLRRHADAMLPRALSLLIGNVAAAREGVRHRADQPDYNRVWAAGDSAEHVAMAQVVERMRERKVFASIDIHNNTGLNPHYACINRLEQSFLHLAALFSRTMVYFTQPDGVQSMAFSRLCPAVTVECGKAGQGLGTEHALNFIDAALHLSHFPEHDLPPQDYDLFHTVVTVKVPAGTLFGFDADHLPLSFPTDLDHLNFRELPAGTVLARVQGSELPLAVWNEAGENVVTRYFTLADGQLRTRLPVMPSMLTLNAEVIRQDCLCYLMERMPALD